MRVPTRKPGKYAHFKPDPHMTRKKFKDLERELERLKKGSRPKVIAEVQRLAADGDFSENAAYQIAKGRLRGINRRILEVENLLKRAQIIEPQANDGTVRLGSSVTVLANGKERIFQILGSAETDPAKGIISHNSPIGRALIGRKKGEQVEVLLADKTVYYKIIRIE